MTDERARQRLQSVVLDEDSLAAASRDQEQERQIAIFDLLEDNYFAPDGAAGGPYDLICFFDSYHDLGDPHLAAAHARTLLSPGGSLMLVEPFASPQVHENVGPVARLYFSASTTMCTPNALSQGSVALGAQAGPERLAASLREAGFLHVSNVHEDPFNMVLQAKA